MPDRWTREQLLLAFNLYCKIPFGRIHNRNPEIETLATAIGRTPSALAMKMVNFASLDPVHQSRNVKGLSNASQQDRTIFEEFRANWEALAFESEAARKMIQSKQWHESEPRVPPNDAPTEVLRTVRARTVQGFFRRAVLASYEAQCAICAMRSRQLLCASHIIPWSSSVARRADPTNGIAFCSLHDRAFDRGLISFDQDYSLIVAPSLLSEAGSAVHSAAFVEMIGSHLKMPKRFLPDPEALRFHRETLFRG
jgi:predicted restriction endonuclease